MSTTIIIVILAVVFTAIVCYFVITKQIKSSWKGTLVSKKTTRQRVDRHQINGAKYSMYQLIFETDTGKKITLSVNGNFYDECKIGDKFEKISGQINPKKNLTIIL